MLINYEPAALYQILVTHLWVVLKLYNLSPTACLVTPTKTTDSIPSFLKDLQLPCDLNLITNLTTQLQYNKFANHVKFALYFNTKQSKLRESLKLLTERKILLTLKAKISSGYIPMDHKPDAPHVNKDYQNQNLSNPEFFLVTVSG